MKPLKPFEIPLSGMNLIEASAGTGKTYNITSLYVRTLIEKPVTVDQILVMTFTKAATKELKDRLLTRLRESIYVLKNEKHGGDAFFEGLLDHVRNRRKAITKLKQAVHSFDEAAVFTIHGFCQQVLQQHAFESGVQYDAELIEDESELIRELIDDYWRGWVNEASNDSTKGSLLKWLVDHNYNPDKLFQEVSGINQLHHKKVISENSSFDWEEVLNQLRSQRNELQAIWKDSKGVISEELRYKHLNGQRYKQESIPDWMKQMDKALNNDILPIELFNEFEKFTQTYLDASLNEPATRRVTHPFFEVAEKYWNTIQELPDYSIEFKVDLLSFLKKELPLKKEKLGLLSYSDQLTKLQKSLQSDMGDRLAATLRKNYPVALVDEYQDTDPIQYDIFQMIFGGRDNGILFFMIGDPKQSIYGFRGADIFSYLKARDNIPRENVLGLSSNFRSVPKLIDAFNVLWSRSKAPFVIDDIVFTPVVAGKDNNKYKQLTESGKAYPPVHFRKLSKPNEEKAKGKKDARKLAAEDTAGEIERLLEGGQSGEIKIGEKAITGKEIAVLVRTHKQADLIREALRERGIKSVQYGNRSVFKSEEAEQLAYVLQAIISPSNERLIKTALATPLMGYDSQELLEIEEQGQPWIEILVRFAEWHRLWEQQGFSAMFGHFMKRVNVAERLVGLLNGERRLTNILHLAELLQNEERKRDGMRWLLKWMTQKKEDKKKSADEEQLRLESDEDLVKIVTMHSSKGLEFPIVFCPFLWHGPHINDKGQVLEYHEGGEAILDFSGKQDEERTEKRQMARRERLAEDMRLAYVAMTRAEHHCYLSWCYAKSCEFSSLGYFLYGAEEAIKALNDKINKNFDSLGNYAANKVINALCEDYPELFSCEPINRDEEKTLDLFKISTDELQPARTFNRAIPLPAGETVSSFSSLIRMPDTNPDIPDYDQFLFDTEGEERKTGHQNDMFGFPKGAGPGTCLHKIFEEIDFSDRRTFNPVVSDNLSFYSINAEWKNVTEQMLETTVQKKLLDSEPKLSLSAIQPGRYIREMEFYYKSAQVETTDLFSIIREKVNSGTGPQNKAAEGFLKGFIDLTFEFEGKYYLLDYKSNYLGDTFEDYSEEALRNEMILSSYDLQYHIYTIALHRFLRNKLDGYSYDGRFGGVFYLFLRGIKEDGSTGIFYDRPDINTVQQLDRYLLEGVKV